jgi:hypothetical protein
MFKVKTQSWKKYELYDENEVFLAELVYTSWAKSQADVTVVNQAVMSIEKQSFWGLSYDVTQSGQIMARINRNFWGRLTIETLDAQNQPLQLTVKRKGIFNPSLYLADELGHVYMELNWSFNWSSFSTVFNISIAEDVFASNPTFTMVGFFALNLKKMMDTRST